MQLGFIGLGIMGAPQAQNLLRAGYSITVATRTPGKAEKFAQENKELGNVRAVNTAAEVAEASEIIITMVTDSPDVVAVARGEHGIFTTAKPGTIIIDMSTISPKVTQELAAEAEAKGLIFQAITILTETLQQPVRPTQEINKPAIYSLYMLVSEKEDLKILRICRMLSG